MSMYTYQNKAWKKLEEHLELMVKHDDDGRYAEMKELMSKFASEAFKERTKTEDVADLLMDAVNSSAFDEEAFATQITQRTHRTLQQSFFRAIMATIKKWSEFNKAGIYDLRNESTVKASTKIEEALKDDYFPLI